jgi:putative RecB family exonuclease
LTEKRLPSALSPSSISTYEQCPRRFQYSRIDRLPDPSGPDAVLGTFVHGVLEDVFGLEAEERGIESARAIATRRRAELEGDPEYVALGLSDVAARAWRRRAWGAVSGYFALEDPRTVKVESREQDVRVELSGVAVRGIIDRVDSGDGGAIADYKTGKVPAPRYRGKALAQLELYAAALAALGRPVRRVRLLYVSHGETIESGVGVAEIGRAVERVVRVDGAIRADFAAASFAPRPGPLCPWCAYQAICPAMGGTEPPASEVGWSATAEDRLVRSAG